MNHVSSGAALRTVMALLLGSGVFTADWASAQQRPADKKQEEKATVKTPADTLLKNIGNATSRQKALQELVQRLAAAEADTDILMRSGDFVKALYPMVKNTFDKNLASLAVEALAVLGRSNPEAVDLFVDEMQKGTASSRVLAVRGIGNIGASAKEKAFPELMKILNDPQIKTGNAALYNEALMSRALLGGPFEAEIMPDMIRVLISLKEPRLQFEMALSIAQDPELLKTYSVQLEPVVLKYLQLRPLPLDSEANRSLFKGFLFVAVKIGTRSSQETVSDLWRKNPPGYWESRDNLAKVFGEIVAPPDYVVSVLSEVLKKETEHATFRSIAQALAGYGVAARDALPLLRQIQKDMPKKDYGKDVFREIVSSSLNSAIQKIEEAIAAMKKEGSEAKIEMPDAARSEVKASR